MESLRNALHYLGLVVNGLVDEGYSEKIEKIEKQIEEGNIMNYIISRYKDIADFTVFEDGGPYSTKEVNEFLANYLVYGGSYECEKFGVTVKNGLCLITALCLEGLFDIED